MDNNKPSPGGKRPTLPRGTANEIMNERGTVLHGIDIINSQYKIEYASRPMLNRYGSLEGKTCYEVYMNRKKPCENCPATKAIKTMKPAETDFEGRDGRHYIVSASPVKNKDGSVSAVETILDVTERVRREKEQERSKSALQASEKRFKSLIETSSDWVWELDRNAVYTYASPKVKDLLGYEPEEVVGRTPFDLMLPDEAERISEIFRDIVVSRKPFDRLENVNLHKDGRRVVLETSGVPILDAGGNLLGYRGIDRDISERKNAEEELRKFKTISDRANYGTAISDLGENIIYVNDAFARMHGYTPDELANRNISFLHTKEQLAEVERLNDILKKEGDFSAQEVWHKRKDGTVFLALMNASIIRDEKGTPLFMSATSIDITEHKNAEEALRESEERFRNLMEYIPGISIQGYNTKGTVRYWNKASEHVYGYTTEEAVGRNLGDLIITEDVKPQFLKALEIGKKATISGELLPAGEVTLLHKDGSPVNVYSTHTVVCIEGKETLMFCLDIDLSERQKAEEALSDRLRYEETLAHTSHALLKDTEGDNAMEEALRHLLAGSGVGRVYIFENFEDVDGELCMRQTHEICAPGVKLEIDNELLQHLPYEPDFNRWAETLSRGLPIAGTVEEFPESERSVLDPQDILSILVLPIWVRGRWYGFIGFDETQHKREWSGEVIRMLQTASEMIASYLGHRQFEEALKESSSKLATLAEEQRILLEHTRDFVYRHDTHGIFTYLSPSVEQITGYSIEDWKTHYTKFMTDNPINEKGVEYTEETLRTGKESPTYFVEIRHKDVRPILLEVNERAYFQEGKIGGIIGVARDVTKRERTGEALRDSEAKYKTLYESSRDAIMMLTPEEGFFSGNPATLKMFACKDEQEFTTQTPANLSPAHQPDGILSTVKAQQMMAAALEKGSHFFEWTHKRFNGEEFYATVLLTKVELKGRTFLQATVRDITERKRVEEALRASEERLWAIINTAPGVVYTAIPNESHTKTFVSANIIELIGHTPEEMVQNPSLWESLILPEDRKKYWAAIEEHRKKKGRLEIEYRVVHKNGHIAYVLDRATPILDNNDNISIIEGIMMDISERKRLQERIVQADKLSAIGEMVAGVAHELNNPMGIISGHIQLLLSRVKDREIKYRLKKMATHVKRGTKIINNLLSFSRKSALDLEPGNINATIERALENTGSEFTGGNIKVVKKLADALPPLKFDHHQMLIVFTNIMKNAFQALMETGKEGEIHITSSRSDGTVSIRIRDTGPGIKPAILKNIFDPFFTTKKVGAGTGLGLSIAYGIVKEHRGNILASNAKNGGLVITVKLPL